MSADGCPFGVEDLDDEGRCIVTDHCQFVLINVYVPNTAGGPRTTYHLRFLEALERLVAKYKGQGREVCLVGDFNVRSFFLFFFVR